mmetsp:Transcript_10401/g.15818  ORF Transcript_10401/g.15818 Transcript_10401/m.15818 type:complete len:430 (+) Transcript_10401:89-1378(+)
MSDRKRVWKEINHSEDEVISKRLCIQTRRSNCDNVTMLCEWIRDHKDPSVSSLYHYQTDEFVLPIPSDTLIEFFYHICFGSTSSDTNISTDRYAHNSTPHICNATTIESYHNAIKSLYQEAGMSHMFPDDDISLLIARYKKTIADKSAVGQARTSTGFKNIPDVVVETTELTEDNRLTKRVADLEKEICRLTDEIKRRHEDDTTKTELLVRKLSVKIADDMVKKYPTSGVRSVPSSDSDAPLATVADLDRCLRQFSSEMTKRLEDLLSRVSGATTTSTTTSPNQNIHREEETTSSAEWSPFMWGGGLHWIPENYVFPAMTVRQLWNRWLYGNKAEGICPYRLVGMQSISSSQKPKFSKAKYVMDILLKICEDKGYGSASEISKISNTLTNKLFSESFIAAVGSNDAMSSRLAELSYITVYNKLKKIENN